jgi:hypothetical protein
MDKCAINVVVYVATIVDNGKNGVGVIGSVAVPNLHAALNNLDSK